MTAFWDRHGQETEIRFHAACARRAEAYRTLGDAGREGPSAHYLLAFELGREYIQMPLCDEVDLFGVVERERTMGARLEGSAPDLPDDVVYRRHGLNSR